MSFLCSAETRLNRKWRFYAKQEEGNNNKKEESSPTEQDKPKQMRLVLLTTTPQHIGAALNSCTALCAWATAFTPPP